MRSLYLLERNFEDREKGRRKYYVSCVRVDALYLSSRNRLVSTLLLHLSEVHSPPPTAMTTGDIYDYLAGSIEQFPSKDTLSQQILEAGFSSVKATGLTASIVAIHEANKA